MVFFVLLLTFGDSSSICEDANLNLWEVFFVKEIKPTTMKLKKKKKKKKPVELSSELCPLPSHFSPIPPLLVLSLLLKP